MSYEAWRISFQSSEQAAREAFRMWVLSNDENAKLHNQLKNSLQISVRERSLGVRVKELENITGNLYKALQDMCYDYRHKHGLDGAYDAVLLQAEAALKEATNVK
jgi:hypothetical protein